MDHVEHHNRPAFAVVELVRDREPVVELLPEPSRQELGALVVMLPPEELPGRTDPPAGDGLAPTLGPRRDERPVQPEVGEKVEEYDFLRRLRFEARQLD